MRCTGCLMSGNRDRDQSDRISRRTRMGHGAQDDGQRFAAICSQDSASSRAQSARPAVWRSRSAQPSRCNRTDRPGIGSVSRDDCHRGRRLWRQYERRRCVRRYRADRTSTLKPGLTGSPRPTASRRAVTHGRLPPACLRKTDWCKEDCANKSRRAALSHRDEIAQPQEQEQEI